MVYACKLLSVCPVSALCGFNDNGRTLYLFSFQVNTRL